MPWFNITSSKRNKFNIKLQNYSKLKAILARWFSRIFTFSSALVPMVDMVTDRYFTMIICIYSLETTIVQWNVQEIRIWCHYNWWKVSRFCSMKNWFGIWFSGHLVTGTGLVLVLLYVKRHNQQGHIYPSNESNTMQSISVEFAVVCSTLFSWQRVQYSVISDCPRPT